MKKAFIAIVAVLFISSCEVEYRGDVRYNHPWGWEHHNHPEHHDVYDHGYHHDEHGDERR